MCQAPHAAAFGTVGYWGDKAVFRDWRCQERTRTIWFDLSHLSEGNIPFILGSWRQEIRTFTHEATQISSIVSKLMNLHSTNDFQLNHVWREFKEPNVCRVIQTLSLTLLASWIIMSWIFLRMQLLWLRSYFNLRFLCKCILARQIWNSWYLCAFVWRFWCLSLRKVLLVLVALSELS